MDSAARARSRATIVLRSNSHPISWRITTSITPRWFLSDDYAEVLDAIYLFDLPGDNKKLDFELEPE
ncbi:hypothetical protein Pfo_016790 [Paulownia fortunei]|nr:hypothetical protein Pfo_016790 [Paulownia fortunei]